MKKYDVILKNKIEGLKKAFPTLLLEEFVQDKANQGMLFITAILFAVIWIFSLYRFHVNDFLVPVRYSSFMGVTEIGRWFDLYRTPLFFTVSVVVNLLLANVIYKKDRMITYILVGTNVFLGLVALMLIINFSNIIGKL